MKGISVMEHGFLRYEVRLIKPDGSSKVLETEATAHRCNIIQNRLKRMQGKMNYNAELKFRVSKVLPLNICVQGNGDSR